MPESFAIEGFLPSTDGLRFANTFPPGPTLRLGPLDPRRIGVGDASAGLCGGMCLFVRRRFEAGQDIPSDATVPANGSPLFRQLVREQVRSLRLGIVPLRFWGMSRMRSLDRADRTLRREWPRIRASLDEGRLTAIGLVRVAAVNPFKLIGNHQVLAYGYDIDGDTLRIRIYDPNWPNRDDITVAVTGLPGSQSTGETLLGIVALD